MHPYSARRCTIQLYGEGTASSGYGPYQLQRYLQSGMYAALAFMHLQSDYAVNDNQGPLGIAFSKLLMIRWAVSRSDVPGLSIRADSLNTATKNPINFSEEVIVALAGNQQQQVCTMQRCHRHNSL